MINEELSVKGAGLGALQDQYRVHEGTELVNHKTLVKWTDGEIRFLVRSEPGERAVSLEPLVEGLPRIAVGEVTVLKYRLPPEGFEIVPDFIYVRLTAGTTSEQVRIEDDRFERIFPDAPQENLLGHWYKVNVPSGKERERILSYAALAGVELAEYSSYLHQTRAANDPCYQSTSSCLSDTGLFALQWNVKKARLTAAWEVLFRGEPIAILDTGVRATHEELLGRVIQNQDCSVLVVCTATAPQPCGAHGTFVASIAAANTSNGNGIAGGAWNASIGSYKVFPTAPGGGCLTTDQDTVARAINAAAANGFRIINMSLACTGAACFNQMAQNAVNNAWNNGAFLVAAAGNDNVSTITFPANYANVFAVAATDENDGRWVQDATHGSQFGNWVDLAAPGAGIVGAHSGSDVTYAFDSGTSHAAPLVAAAAAILRTAGYNNAAIGQRLLAFADQVNWDPTRVGEGRLNAYRAIYPDRACLRDLPIGAWVNYNGTVYQVAGANLLRGLPHGSALTSWRGVESDLVSICAERKTEMIEGSWWGYRPGTLVSDPANGAVYLITTDGDRGLPQKRGITSPAVFECYGWQWGNIITGYSPLLAAHATGPVIGSCTPGARSFPNGSIVRSPGGSIYVIDAGSRRGIPSWQVYQTWFGDTQWTQATDFEIALIPIGSDWGFRQGRQIQPSGSGGVYFVTDDGSQRARGSRRVFPTYNSWAERGYTAIAVSSGVSSSIVGLHPEGAQLLDADNMP